MKYTIALSAVLLAGCGADAAIDSIENLANQAADTLDQITEQQEPAADAPQFVPDEPETFDRPRIVEDYQYLCSTNDDASRTWTWTFRPSLDIADEFGVVVGAWHWNNQGEIQVRPIGNDQARANLVGDPTLLTLENWGGCRLSETSGRNLGEQFTRPLADTVTIIRDSAATPVRSRYQCQIRDTVFTRTMQVTADGGYVYEDDTFSAIGGWSLVGNELSLIRNGSAMPYVVSGTQLLSVSGYDGYCDHFSGPLVQNLPQ